MRAVLRAFASRYATRSPRGRFPPTSVVATSQSAESCKSAGCDSSEDEGATTTTTTTGLVSRRGLITISAITRDSAHLETRMSRACRTARTACCFRVRILRSVDLTWRGLFRITLESQLELAALRCVAANSREINRASDPLRISESSRRDAAIDGKRRSTFGRAFRRHRSRTRATVRGAFMYLAKRFVADAVERRYGTDGLTEIDCPA
jgi:hypothetical protein